VWLLALLLIALSLFLFVQFGPGSGYSDNGSMGPRSARKTPQQDLAADPLLLMTQLQAERARFQEQKRNLFAFYKPSVPVQTKQEVVEEQAPLPVCGDSACEGAENFANCAADCAPPPPPEIRLRYIGYLQEEGGAVAFLTDGKDIFMGRINDIIANRYRVLKITEESVELGFIKGDQSRTIRFQGSGRG
jgi:hypothetical protein